MIGLISATAAGRGGCARLAAAWPGRTRLYDGPVREALPVAFAECDQLVLFLATGAAVRLLAPLLTTKRADPAVVTVDEAHRHAVALLGGHASGANALAEALSPVLGTTPVVTTATDAVGVSALDLLPYPAEGALPAVTRALLDGERVAFRADTMWPLPALPIAAPAATPPPTSAVPLPAAAAASGDPNPPKTAAGNTATNPVAPHADTSRAVPARPLAAPAGTTPPTPAVPLPAAAAASGDPNSPETPADNPATDPLPALTPTPRRPDAPLPGAAAASGDPTSPETPAGSGDSATARGGGGSTAVPEDAGLAASGGGRSGPAGGPGSGGGTAAAGDEYLVWVTDRLVDGGGRAVYVRPPSLVVGVGGSRGVGVEEVAGLIAGSLAEAGLAAKSVAALATVDAKAGEPGIVAAAARLKVPLLTYPAAALAEVAVPNPSAAPLAAVGTPSVAEAAALLGAPGGELVVQKRKSAMATVAVARRKPRGRLAVVGLGPGARDLMTPRAEAELRRASVIVGLDQYVDQIRDLLAPGTRVLESGLGAEEERARTAVAQALEGHAVALIGSGDAGVYAMASPALAEASDDIDVVGVPGVTAALAAAALLGAPLGHDHVSISLSDLHTPWDVIERRVRAAAESDLVVTFYNPRSRGRDWQLPKALAILAEHRSPATPVGVVHAASRPDERAEVTTLATLDVTTVDMVTVVTVGNTATREIAGRMVTPRGYRWQS
ncbi:precorrin-3B C(17)-methyltransferase [Streptomyces polygonati]|uniref:Precorrin-3B C(17)-methyltransferase n=1 Tax=Streptomyces polygonati TaxID=1617087 RepID=A0ABV8HHJ5_9ACTN